MTDVNDGQQIYGFLMERNENDYYECKYSLIYPKISLQAVNILHGTVI
jgi:hypothetical protein